MSPAEFAALFVGMAAAVEVGFAEEMEEVGKVVEEEAKAIIGHYQTGIAPLADWEPLSPDTLEDKENLGFSPPDNPLLRTGLMRDGVEHCAGPMEARIGSNDPVMLWQELGTPNIPPRSVLGAAAIKKADEVGALVWGGTKAILEGTSGAVAHLVKP